MDDQRTRRAAIGLGFGGVLAATPALARQTREFDSNNPLRGRMTVPVRINGDGVYVFVVDTAANTSVISADIADRLQMPDAGAVTMHTLVGREVARTVICRSLDSGAMHRRDHRLALASRRGLDGADGLIGVDLLKDFRLVLNFRGVARMRIARSGITPLGFLDPVPPSARLSTVGDQRFGHLLMVPAQIAGIHAMAIIDTGARLTIVNTRLVEAVGARYIPTSQGSDTQRVMSPTGASVSARMAILPPLTFAEAVFRRTPVLVGDFHTFDLWGLSDTPALLVGVDLLGMLSSVSIDVRRGELILKI